MAESSRLRHRRGGCEQPVVAQKRPHHVGPSAGERDDGLHMLESLAPLLQVEVTVFGLRGRC